MKKIKFLLPILVLSLYSCDNYMDINDENPNQLLFDQVTPEKLLPAAQVGTFRVQATTANQLGNVFMNSWTRNVQSYGNGFDRELQLNIDNSFYNGIWDGYYRNLKNFDGIIKYANPNGDYDYYQAAALICRAHYMQQIVDLYGDCPFSEAFLGAANTTPAYDDDYEIYKALISSLQEARDLIANAPANVKELDVQDTMLQGDMNRWIEFANTIELRMLLRMSEVTGIQATYRDDKLALLSGASFLSDNVTINPGYNGSTDASANPMTNNFFFDVAGTARANRLFIAMAGHAYKAMQSYATTNWAAFGNNYEIVPGSGVNYPNVTDPRSAKLFTAGIGAGGVRRAVTQGSSSVDVTTPTGALPGAPARLGLVATLNPYLGFAGVLEDFNSADCFVMTYAESCFLQAEAAVRYPALFSNEQAWFDAGVSDDFAMRGATLGSYLTTINTKPWFGLAASTTVDEKIHAIMYQKWVALMGLNGIQSYIDYTRTGYPLTPLATVAIQTRKPYRLVYPVSEYIANSANVPAMSANDAFAINALTPFWVQ